MAYLTELHYCCNCDVYLGPDDGDGICGECDNCCDKCGVFIGKIPDTQAMLDDLLCRNCAIKEVRANRVQRADTYYAAYTTLGIGHLTPWSVTRRKVFKAVRS